MGTELDAAFVSSLTLPAVVAFIAFLIRFSIKREKIVALTFFLDTVAAIFVGILVAISLSDYDIPEGLKWGAVTLGAMMGPELLAGILHVAAMFSRSPVTFVVRIIRVVMGNPLTPQELKEMVRWEKDFINEIDDEKKKGGGNDKQE
tara:strand:- start:370 stop:810 length:441 start_codon:yes stop_codon:yes gene_type:complete